MDRKRLSQLCALPLALALLPGMAAAQALEHGNDEAPVELPADAPLDLSTPEPDTGKLTPSKPVAHTPPASDWAGKVGIDYSKPAISACGRGARSVAWHRLGHSYRAGVGGPFRVGQTSIETRIDPSQGQSKLGTTLSRAVPVGED